MTSLTKLSRSVKNMVTLITGAGSGMGRATAKVFADAGAKVIVSDINEQNVIEVTNEILKEKKICSGYVLDITSKGEIENVIEKVIKEFGQLDHLINNAGIAIPLSIDDENYEESWEKTLNVLLTGQVNLIRRALPYLLKSKNPRIVNISSTEGLGATPRNSPYTAAKHGVIGLTRSLASELGSTGLTVNCICPGPIRTAMTDDITEDNKQKYAYRRVPMQRYGDPEEVAHVTLSLCLPASSFINGVALPVDGGLSIKRG
tara:strand:- start:1222 stop:2001 length:780 start_codon:yes stop_codon:yes gene_type:complete